MELDKRFEQEREGNNGKSLRSDDFTDSLCASERKDMQFTWNKVDASLYTSRRVFNIEKQFRVTVDAKEAQSLQLMVFSHQDL